MKAVYECDDPGAEHHAIEWKSALDLDTPEGQFQVARTILAFSNRLPRDAMRHFGGYAYLLVGIEPSQISGMPQLDGERLEPALARFLGPDGPRWHHDNVPFAGANVLVFTVSPPTVGDHIHTLRRQFTPAKGASSAREGEIFVRRSSKSERANTAEIRSLEARLLDGVRSRPIDLDVALAPGSDPVAMPLDLSDAAIEAWVEAERRALQASRSTSWNPLVPNVNANWAQLLADDRSLEDYRAEVDKYLGRMRQALPELTRAAAFAVLQSRRLQLRVRNLDDVAVQDIVIRLQLPAGFEGVFRLDQPERPSRPNRLGTQNKLVALTNAFGRRTPHVGAHSPVAQRSYVSGTEVIFNVGTLHAQQSRDLDPLTLFAGPDVDHGTSVSARATATALDRRGVGEFDVEIHVVKKAYPPMDLMRAEQDPRSSGSVT